MGAGVGQLDARFTALTGLEWNGLLKTSSPPSIKLMPIPREVPAGPVCWPVSSCTPNLKACRPGLQLEPWLLTYDTPGPPPPDALPLSWLCFGKASSDVDSWVLVVVPGKGTSSATLSLTDLTLQQL